MALGTDRCKMPVWVPQVEQYGATAKMTASALRQGQDPRKPVGAGLTARHNFDAFDSYAAQLVEG